MGIIDKLGIEPLSMYSFGGKEWITEDHEEFRKIERDRKYLIQAMIISIECHIESYQMFYEKDCMYETALQQIRCSDLKDLILVLEEATGKTWEEIKELEKND